MLSKNKKKMKNPTAIATIVVPSNILQNSYSVSAPENRDCEQKTCQEYYFIDFHCIHVNKRKSSLQKIII